MGQSAAYAPLYDVTREGPIAPVLRSVLRKYLITDACFTNSVIYHRLAEMCLFMGAGRVEEVAAA